MKTVRQSFAPFALLAAVLTLTELSVAQQYTDLTITNGLKLQATPTAPTLLQLRADGALISLSPTSSWSPLVDLSGVTTDSSLLLWDSGKMAFRAGAFNAQSLSSVGAYSASVGYNTAASHFGFAAGYHTNANYMSAAFGQCSVASGVLAFATGDSAAALGPDSFSAGAATTASGPGAAAFGAYTLASGYVSAALGWNTHAEAYASLVIGRYNLGGYTVNGGVNGDQNWYPQDPIFEIGNGAEPTAATNWQPVRSNALTVYKNGNATFQGVVRVAPGGDIPMFVP
jgi:hypothetical protein